ncbi:MAG: response regulator transcription factor [Clostridiales bacterium]|nr:response regulator transcription factor [Clostridiales bacterium]
MATILIFSENRQIAHKLCDSLNKGKYEAKLCSDQKELRTAAKAEENPLMIMDASMKWTSCRPLLEAGMELNCPVLFITGDRSMSSHLQALYGGRSQVAVWPVGQKMLLELIRQLMGEPSAKRELHVDADTQVVTLNGRRVELTAQEMALLLALMENPDAPVSRETLLREAWGYQSIGETRTVDVHVQRLRKKMGEDWIETVYKCGYRLRLA